MLYPCRWAHIREANLVGSFAEWRENASDSNWQNIAEQGFSRRWAQLLRFKPCGVIFKIGFDRWKNQVSLC
jgi:hypothetical protein